jgi:hypothetical protein
MSPTTETYGLVNEIVARWHTDVNCADALDSLADATFVPSIENWLREVSTDLVKFT